MINQRKRILLFVAIPILLIFGMITVRNFETDSDFVMDEETYTIPDLSDVLERGVLRAATDFNSTSYFIYRGEPMGFHLELLRLFASHIGVELEVSVSNSLQDNIDCVFAENGCDVVAQSLWISASARQLVLFTEPHSRSRMMLVQRKPSSWRQMTRRELENYLVRDQLDLAGKTVYVPDNPVFVRRLNHLIEEIGDSIHIVQTTFHDEELFEQVAKGKIDFAVGDETLARLNQMYYADIDVETPLSFHQNLAWAVRPGAEQLAGAINEWLDDFKKTRHFAILYNKYYNNPRSVHRAKSDLHSLGGGKISAFDDYFKRYAEIIGWDWRLIASLSYQESRFNHNAVSWAGAHGIMQLMPATADFLNVDLDAGVSEHIAGGVRYLKWLDQRLEKEIEDEEERVKFVLASYNVGLGHVLDARRLAVKYGTNPNIWKGNVDYYVLNKSNPRYYLDPVVRHGYARGQEPYRYVTEIIDRYHHYRNVHDVLAQHP